MQYICSKTGDEGSIYAARQGMRACNNTNMRNPIIKDVGGLRVLVLLHALIPLHPSTFNGNVFTPLFHCFFVVDSLANTMPFACVRAPPILLLMVM